MDAQLDVGSDGPPHDPEQVGPGVEVLSRKECLQLLRSTTVGRVAFVAAGWPLALPVNFSLDDSDIIIRTDPRSQLARATHRPARVALEVDEPRRLYQSGWSVVAFGLSEWVIDEEESARLGEKSAMPWVRGPRTHVIRITPIQISGRRLEEHGRYPSRLS